MSSKISAIDFEVLAFCRRDCHCATSTISTFVSCQKCTEMAKGYLLERRDHAVNLKEDGFIKWSNGNGWSLTTKGAEAHDRLQTVMDKIAESAGLFMDAEQKAAYEEENRLRTMIAGLDHQFSKSMRSLNSQLSTVAEVRKELGLPTPTAKDWFE